MEILKRLESSSKLATEGLEDSKEKVTISLNNATMALEDAGIEEKDLHHSNGRHGSGDVMQSRVLWAEHNQNGYE